jgi:hypothetical protein
METMATGELIEARLLVHADASATHRPLQHQLGRPAQDTKQ